jgi:hypothetical protein
MDLTRVDFPAIKEIIRTRRGARAELNNWRKRRPGNCCSTLHRRRSRCLPYGGTAFMKRIATMTVADSLPLRSLVGVADKFRIGTGAEFVEIHAQALPFELHALRIEPVQEPV